MKSNSPSNKQGRGGIMTEERSGGARPQPQKKGSGGGGPKPYLCFPNDGGVVSQVGKDKYSIRVIVGLSGKPTDYDQVLRFYFQGALQLKTLKMRGGEREFVFENLKPDLAQSIELKVQIAGTSSSDSVVLDGSLFKKAKSSADVKANEGKDSFSYSVGLVDQNGFNSVQIFTADKKKGTILLNAGQQIQIRRGAGTRQFATENAIRLSTDDSGFLAIDIRPLEREGNIQTTHLETGCVQLLFLGKK